VRDQRSDVQPVIGNGDVFELAQPRDVDDDFRVMGRVLEFDQLIGSARQNLGPGAVLAEQRHGMPDIFRHYISERLHPACFLSVGPRIGGYTSVIYIILTDISDRS